MADSGVPLGIIPLGTLNHFASDLGIPLDLDGAVALIAAGHGGRLKGLVWGVVDEVSPQVAADRRNGLRAGRHGDR